MKSTLREHLVVTAESEVEDEMKRAEKRARQRPRRGARKLEEQEQARFVEWARARGLLLWHTPNASNSVRRAQKMKALGQLAGVADIIIVTPTIYPDERGLAFEFKSDVGKQSQAQHDWQLNVLRCGWRYYVIRSFEQARALCLQLFPWMRP